MYTHNSSVSLRQLVQAPAPTKTPVRNRSCSVATSTFRLLALVLVMLGSLVQKVPAQTLTTLVNFNYTNGTYPLAKLVQGTDGNFYGTTSQGGNATICVNSARTVVGCGTVFRMTPGGTITTLINFNGANGAFPLAGLVQGSDGNFYGTTFSGSNSIGGTVFRMTPSGSLTTLVNFNGNNGTYPTGGLVQGTDGNFYGMTSSDSTSTATCPDFGCGTVFRMTPSGSLTTLVRFNSTNGSSPQASLVQGSDSNFYGTTAEGGNFNYGTVFRVTASGTLTTLVSFDFTNGAFPTAALIQGTDGNFYSTTVGGGSHGLGTVFRMTASGTLTTLVNFNGTNGDVPYAELVEGSDGNFYGTTIYGGSSTNCFDSLIGSFDSCGTVFRVTASGTLTTLINFNNATGYNPYAGLVQSTDNNFYGTTIGGGSSGYGTVFRLSEVIAAVPTITSVTPMTGEVGTSVVITGTNFTGVTTVKFNVTNATSFVVNLPTQITVTVPIGATTGAVSVTTPGGTAIGGSFTVIFPSSLPTISSFTPTSGAVGTSVVITGTNLAGATAVKFGTANATSFAVNSPTQITATVPNGATTGELTVTTPSGTAVGGIFTLILPVPTTISSFFPTVGPPTTRVTLTGTNFTGVTSVTLNGTTAAFTINSATQITLIVPTGATSGAIAVTTTSGTTSKSGYRVTPYAIRAAGWQLVNAGDFNADGQSDLIWRNYTTGENAIWLMNGTSFSSSVLLGSVTDLTWQLVGAADMTQDGKLDLLWRNYATGENALWQMDGTNFITGFPIDTVTDFTWQLIGAADYSGDGQPDLLWRNYTTSQNAIWVMNGVAYNGAADLGPIDLAWQMVSPGPTSRGGSFNGDAAVDILWRNLITTDNAVWYMNQTVLIQGVLLPALPDTNWQMIGSGDFDGDNQPDLIWRNFITGDNAIWLMNGVGLEVGVSLGSVSP